MAHPNFDSTKTNGWRVAGCPTLTSLTHNARVPHPSRFCEGWDVSSWFPHTSGPIHFGSARFPRTINEKRSTLNGNKAQETMPLSARELLEKELESVERDVQAIEDEIANDPPDTTGELLRLREIQRTYRGIAVSIKQAIALEDVREKQQSQ
jgi:hypothetical protein